MKKHVFFFGCLILICLVSIQVVSAVPSELHNMPATDPDVGETFELRFEIKADETTNYSIIIHPGIKFSEISGNTSKTIEIPKDETRTFAFNMVVNEELADGKHAIYYNATKEDVIFKSDIIYVRAGKQVPGFELLLVCAAISISFLVWKKRKSE